MRIGLFFIVMVVIVMTTNVFAADSLSCAFKNICDADEAVFLYANNNSQNDGFIFNSHASIYSDFNYNQKLCCKSDYVEFSVKFIDSDQSCGDSFELMYFTDSLNSHVGFKNYNLDENGNFVADYYSKKSCVDLGEDFNLFDIQVSDSSYEHLGYSCMYQINDIDNAHISDCDSVLDDSYKVWGRLWEKSSSLKCRKDCTSTLDDRVYTSCAGNIESCRDVPESCNGALLGSWVEVLPGSSKEVQCSAPWNITREALFTDEKIDVTSVEGCGNLISKNYPVVLNNQKVNMRIYVCED